MVSSINEIDDAMPTTTAIAFSMNNSQPLSRRTRLIKGDNQLGTFGAGDRFYRPSSIDGGLDTILFLNETLHFYLWRSLLPIFYLSLPKLFFVLFILYIYMHLKFFKYMYLDRWLKLSYDDLSITSYC